MVVNFILENCHLLSRTDEHHTPTIYFGNSTIMINTYILLRKLCLPLLFCILVSFTSYKSVKPTNNNRLRSMSIGYTYVAKPKKKPRFFFRLDRVSD